MAWTDAIPGGSMIDSFFNPGAGYEDASKKMEEAWRNAQKWQVPYWQQGQDQWGRLNEAENKLLNPNSLLDEWMSKYEQSPWAKQTMENSREAGLEAASSQGLMGSSAATKNIQQSAHDVMSADRERYMQDMMQKYMAGIGIGQNIYGTGAQMGSNLGQQSLNAGGYMGDMAYGQRAAGGNRLADMMNAMAKMYLSSQTGGAGAAGGMR
jgi:hypothetical protein